MGIPRYEIRDDRVYALTLENGLLKLLREDTVYSGRMLGNAIRVYVPKSDDVVVVDYITRRPTGKPWGYEVFPILEKGGKRQAWVIIDLGLVVVPLALELIAGN